MVFSLGLILLKIGKICYNVNDDIWNVDCLIEFRGYL